MSPTNRSPVSAASPPRTLLDEVSEVVRSGLERAAVGARSQGIPVPDPAGKLFRPTLAYALVPRSSRADLDERFWLGALAVQMVHEASLLHDDIIDGAVRRRGRETVSQERGPAEALLRGDHYLTGAYRLAAATGSSEFLHRFIIAVERTVAGEALQGASVGRVTDLDTYFRAILGKSGELFGAAASLGGALRHPDRLDELASIGRQAGALYQQIDDLLDFCSFADTGKEPLRDYRQGKWTWVFEVAGLDGFDMDEAALGHALFGTRGAEPSAAERALTSLEVRRRGLLRASRPLVPSDDALDALTRAWLDTARVVVQRELAARAAPSLSRERGVERRRDTRAKRWSLVRWPIEALTARMGTGSAVPSTPEGRVLVG